MAVKDENSLVLQQLKHPQDAETSEEKKIRYRSIRIAQLAMFIFATGFSIILTGVYPYMKELSPELDEETILARYGWVVSVNPLGQMIASPLFGWLYQKTGSARLVGLITSVAYIVGNILYSILSVFPEDYRYGLLLFSRFIVGVSSGNIATVRSYIAAATFTEERTAQMSVASSFQSVGFTLGPGIQAALTPFKCTDVEAEDSQYLSFDMYTSAGWVCAFLGLLSFILFLPFIFKEVDVSLKERQYATECNKLMNEEDVSLDLPSPDTVAAVICIAAFFTYVFNFVLIETLGTPLCMDQFGWSEEETVLYFGILIASASILCVFLFAIVGPLCKRFDERKVLIFVGILFMFLGRIIVFPIPGFDHPPLANSTAPENGANFTDANVFKSFLVGTSKNIPCENAPSASTGCALEWCKDQPALQVWQLFGGIIIGTIGYPFAIAITQSIFSKIIGPRPQGHWMGLFSSVADSLPRLLGLFVVSFIYTNYGMYLTAGLMVFTVLIALVLILIFYKRLIPMDTTDSGGPRIVSI